MVVPTGGEQGLGRPALSVVVPAHNEREWLSAAVEEIVASLAPRPWSWELVICENGSTDGTLELAEDLAAARPEVRVLSLPEADYGKALRAGFLTTHGDLVVNFDVDLVDLVFLGQALDAAAAGADVVIGTKRGPGASDGRPLVRRVVTAGFSVVMRLGFGLRASDTHGIKLLRRSSTVDLVAGGSARNDTFDTELVLRAERAGRKVVEVPVTVTERRPARTSISSRIPRTLAGLVRLRIALWREERGGP